jgi:hypothetical protein
MIRPITSTARTVSWLAQLAALAGLGATVVATGQARAAIEHDSDTSEGVFRSAELNFATTVAAGDHRYLLAAVVTAGMPAILSVSHAGTALGFIGGVSSPGGNCQVQWWGLVAPSIGTLPFRVQVSAASDHLSAAVISYRGVASAGTVGSFVPAQGSAGPSVVTTASAPGEVVLDGVCGWSADSLLLAAGDQQEARWHWSTGSLSSAGSQKPGASTVTMSWTESGAGTMEWGAAGVVLRPAGVVPSIPLDVQTAGCTVAAGSDRHAMPRGLLALGLSCVGLWAVRRRRHRQRAAAGELSRAAGV